MPKMTDEQLVAEFERISKGTKGGGIQIQVLVDYNRDRLLTLLRKGLEADTRSENAYERGLESGRESAYEEGMRAANDR